MLVGVFAVSLLMSGSAMGGVLYEPSGPVAPAPDGYRLGSGTNDQNFAQRITIEEPTTITKVEAYLEVHPISSPGENVEVHIASDDDGKPGETLFSSEIVVPPFTFEDDFNWLDTGEFSLTLLEPDQYWVVFRGQVGETEDDRFWGRLGHSGYTGTGEQLAWWRDPARGDL